MKPLYAWVFLDTVWICFLTAFFTLIVGYPLAYALVHARSVALKSTILVITVTPLFLGEVVRTYSWIVVLGNNGFVNSMLLKAGLIEQPLQLMPIGTRFLIPGKSMFLKRIGLIVSEPVLPSSSV